MTSFSDLINKTLASVETTDDKILFTTTDGSTYKMYHEQDCCEGVYVDDICGDLNDLIGSPIFLAEERSRYETDIEDVHESVTWTFYHLATCDAHITITWRGASNGYYSESVDFVEL